MPSHDEELKRFFNTPPPEEDAEFEREFEKFAQEIEIEEVFRNKERLQEWCFELLEENNQLRKVKSPVPAWPPYLRFMCEAAKELQLPKAIAKQVLEDWLRNKWPDYLGKISNRKIAAMATYLRDVDAQKGGYLRQDK